MSKKIGKRKTGAGGRKEERIVLVRSSGEVLRQLLCLFATSTVRKRKIKNIKSKKEKAGNLFIILRMVEVKKSKNVIYYAKICEEKKNRTIIYI